MNIKKIKCQTCGEKYDWDNKDEIELAVNTCSRYGCSLKQTYEMVNRMDDKKADKARQVPMVLQPFTRKQAPANDSEERCNWCKETGICSSKYCQYELSKDVPTRVNADKTFEVEVPDPIVLFVAKNGAIEDRSNEAK